MKKDIVEHTDDEDEESEFSLTDFLSWFSETPTEETAAAEEEEIIPTGTFLYYVLNDQHFNQEQQRMHQWMTWRGVITKIIYFSFVKKNI